MRGVRLGEDLGTLRSACSASRESSDSRRKQKELPAHIETKNKEKKRENDWIESGEGRK